MTYRHENKEAQISSKQKDTIQTQCMRIKHSNSLWYQWYSKILYCIESNPRKLLSNCLYVLHKALLRQHLGPIRSQTFLAVVLRQAFGRQLLQSPAILLSKLKSKNGQRNAEKLRNSQGFKAWEACEMKLQGLHKLQTIHA